MMTNSAASRANMNANAANGTKQSGSNKNGAVPRGYLSSRSGVRPYLTPMKMPLDLLFFRRIFSDLHNKFGDERGEVPISVFQRAVVRLFRVLRIREEFEASEYDVDGSGAVGWFEFVACWRKSKVCVKLSVPERVYFAIEEPASCVVGHIWNCLTTGLVALSCVCFIFGTLPNFNKAPCEGCEPQQMAFFGQLEGICVAMFTVEYTARVITAPLSRRELLDLDVILQYLVEHEDHKMPSRFKRLMTFVLHPMNIIDLAIILPYYVQNLVDTNTPNLTVLRVLRLTRLFRLIRIGKTFEAMQVVMRVMLRSRRMFSILGVYLVLGVCFSSASFYFVESGSWDPEEKDYIIISHDGEKMRPGVKSIPHAMWWCFVTLTTTGYGDVVPVTVMGKLVSCCTMLMGILVLAMPVGVIATHFNEVWNEWDQEQTLALERLERDRAMVSIALLGMECYNHLVIEIYDERVGREKAEFLGEVQWNRIPLESQVTVSEEVSAKLIPNREKKDSDKIQGVLAFLVTWRPSTNSGPDQGISGTLDVEVLRADGLPRSDWKKNGCRDLYAVVNCYPRAPSSLNEGVAPEKRRTSTAHGTLTPVWEQRFSFQYDWPPNWDPLQSLPKASEGAVVHRHLTSSTMGSEVPSESGLEQLTRLVTEQGRDVKQLASEMSEIRQLLLEMRAELSQSRPSQARERQLHCHQAFLRASSESNLEGSQQRSRPGGAWEEVTPMNPMRLEDAFAAAKAPSCPRYGRPPAEAKMQHILLPGVLQDYDAGPLEVTQLR